MIFLLLILPLAATERVVNVGLYENPPKIFSDENGEPAGIFVDIMDAIASEQGWKLNWHSGSWEENLRLVREGRLDLMPDVAVTEERKLIYDFHENPVLLSWSQIFSHRDRDIRTFSDLEGMRIAVLTGSVQQRILEEIVSTMGITVNLILLDSFDEALHSVSDREADAVATSVFYGRMKAREFRLKESPLVFQPSTLFFVSQKGSNADLLDAIDKSLSKIKKDPNSIYFQSLRHWTPEAQSWGMPSWLKLSILLMGVAMGISVLAGLILKRQVRLRTKALKKANLEMEKRIEERTEELGFALRQAQVADMLKSAFLSTMSHELRTPLNSIIGFTGILLQGLPGEINDEQKKMLGIVQTSSRHLLSLINDVLDISKIEAGQLELHLSDVNLRKITEKTIGLVSLQAEDKGLKLDLHIDRDTYYIRVDQRRFEQVLLNLLSNAIKFTDQGSVSMICTSKDDNLWITISDTGIGIPKDKFDNLFIPFQQIDMGLTRRFEGTGLGLSISQKLIRLMGGDITVESEINKGSSFHIILPLHQENNDG